MLLRVLKAQKVEVVVEAVENGLREVLSDPVVSSFFVFPFPYDADQHCLAEWRLPRRHTV